MKHYAYLFVLSFFLVNCSSEDDGNNPNETIPGPFSVTILETRMDGANIEWTEAIDIDDDPITYSIYLNDQLISTGGTTLSYNFTGLEPETSYDGYIIADDGRGGTSEAGFFFVTEPEVTIETINAVYWLHDSYPEGNGTRMEWRMGFLIPFEENATLYQLQIDEIVYAGYSYSQNKESTWTNESQPSFTYFDEEANGYRVWELPGGINTTHPDYDIFLNDLMNVSGTAQLTITFGSD
ncbi:MAG: hypothetical protein AB8B52_07310 [Winogradskyella sp.]|uniref:hypothetical protein n=1 Tax=Winogradskyella sp. TaxID=1883156 RepID=UPI00385B4BEF